MQTALQTKVLERVLGSKLPELIKKYNSSRYGNGGRSREITLSVVPSQKDIDGLSMYLENLEVSSAEIAEVIGRRKSAVAYCNGRTAMRLLFQKPTLLKRLLE
jgi:hypothetical protein